MGKMSRKRVAVQKLSSEYQEYLYVNRTVSGIKLGSIFRNCSGIKFGLIIRNGSGNVPYVSWGYIWAL